MVLSLEYFLVAFYIKKVGGNSVFLAAIIAEILVLLFFAFTDIPYLWFNFIGCVIVVVLASIFERTIFKK